MKDSVGTAAALPVSSHSALPKTAVSLHFVRKPASTESQSPGAAAASRELLGTRAVQAARYLQRTQACKGLHACCCRPDKALMSQDTPAPNK